MTRLVPDPLQKFNHLGRPERGPERFIELHECECGREFNPALHDRCSTCRAFPLGSRLEAAESNVKGKPGPKPKPWAPPDCRSCGAKLNIPKGSRKTLCPICISQVRRAGQQSFLEREAASGVAA